MDRLQKCRMFLKFVVINFVLTPGLCVIIDVDTVSLADWSDAAFRHLPCMERASWGKGDTLSIEGGIQIEEPHAFTNTIVSWDSVERLIQLAAGSQAAAMEGTWFPDPHLGGGHLNTTLLTAALTNVDDTRVKPAFVQKVLFPEAAVVYVWGDLHGSLHSFLRHLAFLRRMGVLSEHWELGPHVHLLFLGDYVDRGAFGVEVIATALRLRAANPGRGALPHLQSLSTLPHHTLT